MDEFTKLTAALVDALDILDQHLDHAKGGLDDLAYALSIMHHGHDTDLDNDIDSLVPDLDQLAQNLRTMSHRLNHSHSRVRAIAYQGALVTTGLAQLRGYR